MTRYWIRLLIALNLLVLIGLVFYFPHLMVSPGAVSSGHAEIATDCFACHAPWRGAASERCIDCHAVKDIGLRTTKGLALPKKAAKAAFHQELLEKNCMACHSDHAGPKLTQRSRKPFSHALLQVAARNQCQSCHHTPADGLHKKSIGNCSACHTQTAWKPATFDHDKSFVLDRDHNVECKICHVKNDYNSYTCYGCHEHTRQKVLREHRDEDVRGLDNCVKCHRSADGEGDQGGD